MKLQKRRALLPPHRRQCLFCCSRFPQWPPPSLVRFFLGAPPLLGAVMVVAPHLRHLDPPLALELWEVSQVTKCLPLHHVLLCLLLLRPRPMLRWLALSTAQRALTRLTPLPQLLLLLPRKPPLPQWRPPQQRLLWLRVLRRCPRPHQSRRKLQVWAPVLGALP